MSRAAGVALALAGLVATASCRGGTEFGAHGLPTMRAAAAALGTDTDAGYAPVYGPQRVPRIPIRRRVRPCCAFGAGLRVRVGPVPVPAYAIGNVLSPTDLGLHRYDAGLEGDEYEGDGERNGLLYTCRGGFIDTAHVRDYVDWGVFVATTFGRHLETGVQIDFPDDEGGQRRLVLAPVDPEVVRVHGRRELMIPLAQWATAQLSIWHEIATWYGWSAYAAFPERASAFSPEDFYSNMVGIKLVGPLIWDGSPRALDLYNRDVDRWLAQVLAFLGALPRPYGEAAFRDVEGLWWNPEARLPDADVVLRRNFDVGARVDPWLVPADRVGPELARGLRERCGDHTEPHTITNPSRLGAVAFAELVRLEIEVSDRLAERPPFTRLGRVVSQDQFPEILAEIREQARAEFGPYADRPDPAPRG